MVDDPGERIQDILEKIKQATADVEERRREVEAEIARERASRAGDFADLEKKRRAGELGRDWQRLQQRIDLGETTLDDVLRGLDLSDEARAVRRELAAKLPKAREDFLEAIEDGEAAGMLDDIRKAQADLAEALRQFGRAGSGD